jgi:hypothetical protein
MVYLSILQGQCEKHVRKKERGTIMMSKLVMALVFVAFVAVAGGFVALAAWDVPVAQTPVEKTLDASHFLQKSS